MTKIKPLIQLQELISEALSGRTNLSKSFQKFFTETMKLFLTSKSRLNFTQMAREGKMLAVRNAACGAFGTKSGLLRYQTSFLSLIFFGGHKGRITYEIAAKSLADPHESGIYTLTISCLPYGVCTSQ